MLTAELPGIGGQIKKEPEDFEVEEVPAYEPCGSGDHLFLWIEKREMGADYFVKQVAKRLGIDSREVGTAGLKDRHAVTRQMVSVPVTVEEKVGELDGDGIQVLQVNRHTNKLKTGHLHGNKFRVLIRDVTPDGPLENTVSAVLAEIERQGMPNFYGPQRFGHDGETSDAGFAMLRGESQPKSQKKKPTSFFKRLALSAAQSALFNAYLANRLNEGLFRKVLAGDVMSKWPVGGMFVVEDVEAEQARFDAREIVTSGPIFGKKTYPAKLEAAERETAILSDFQLTSDVFGQFGKLTLGTRRHNLVYVEGLSFEVEPEGVRLSFQLPAGCYATVLLREVVKSESGLDRD